MRWKRLKIADLECSFCPAKFFSSIKTTLWLPFYALHTYTPRTLSICDTPYLSSSPSCWKPLEGPCLISSASPKHAQNRCTVPVSQGSEVGAGGLWPCAPATGSWRGGSLCISGQRGEVALQGQGVREAVSLGDGLRPWSSSIDPVPHCPRAFLLGPLWESQD